MLIIVLLLFSTLVTALDSEKKCFDGSNDDCPDPDVDVVCDDYLIDIDDPDCQCQTSNPGRDGCYVIMNSVLTHDEGYIVFDNSATLDCSGLTVQNIQGLYMSAGSTITIRNCNVASEVSISVSSVTITSNKFPKGGPPIHVQIAGDYSTLTFNSGDFQIGGSHNNIISNSGGFIRAAGDYNNIISNSGNCEIDSGGSYNIIENNDCTYIAIGGYDGDGTLFNKVRFNKANTILITGDNNEVVFNEVFGQIQGYDGIGLEGSKNLIANNFIHNVNGRGIVTGCQHYWGDCTDNIIRDNIIMNNSDTGFRILPSSPDKYYENNLFERNYVCYNNQPDIFKDNPENTFTGINNTCDFTSGWDDDGTTGCTFKCEPEIPVILVHGYMSNSDIFIDGGMRDRLTSNGFSVFLSDYSPGDNNCDAMGDIKAYANVLRNEINHIKKITGAKQVDLVVHSMGGLVSRWYVEMLQGQDSVRKIIFMGTPNHGTGLARYARIFTKIPILSLPFSGICSGNFLLSDIGEGGSQMIPNSALLNTLNCNDPKVSSCTDSIAPIYYATTAGFKGIFGLSALLPGEDDGVIPVDSVKLDNVDTHSEHYVNHFGYYEVEEDVVDRVIYLLQNDVSPLALQAEQAEETEIENQIQEIEFSAELNGQTEIEIPITFTQDFSAILVSEGGIELQLISPSGGIIQTMFSQDNLTTSFVENPEEGMWIANISSTSNANFTFLVILETPLYLNLEINKGGLSVNESLEITSSLSGSFNGSIEIEIENPYKERINISNEEIGNNFTGRFNETFIEGDYLIFAKAKGDIGGIQFIRQVRTSFWVAEFADIELKLSLEKINENISIFLNVSNIGDEDAKNVNVEICRGLISDCILINESTFDINAKESKQITAIIEDPGLSIISAIATTPTPESNYLNNIQQKSITFNLSGYVFDSAGNPLTSVPIGLDDEEEALWLDDLTDETGYFEFTGLSEGIYAIFINDEDPVLWNYTAAGIGEDTPWINLTSDMQVNFTLLGVTFQSKTNTSQYKNGDIIRINATVTNNELIDLQDWEFGVELYFENGTYWDDTDEVSYSVNVSAGSTESFLIDIQIPENNTYDKLYLESFLWTDEAEFSSSKGLLQGELGKLDEKKIFLGNTTTFNIPLYKGWNLFSVPIYSKESLLPAPLISIEGNYTGLYTYTGGMWYSYLAGEQPTDKNLEPDLGIWINMTNDDVLEIEGYESEDQNIEFNSGWNLFGYPSLNQSLINETLKNVNYSAVYAYNTTWSSYIPNRTINSLTTLKPGYGYWVKVS